MSALHLLLNLAALLLVYSWRGAAVTGTPGGAMTIVSTVKSAGRRKRRLWPMPVLLAAMLVLRGVLYWHLGRQVEWTATWNLGPFGVSFRSDVLSRMLVFSAVSFAWAAWNCVGWLIVLSALKPDTEEPNPVREMIRAQLGLLARVPLLVALSAMGLLTALLWCGLSEAFSALEILPASASFEYRFEQGLIIGGWALLGCKWPLTALFVARFLDSHVYLGTHPIWGFVQETAGAALRPLGWCRVGRLELAPVLGIAAVWALALAGERLLEFMNRVLPWSQP
jgi:hypothetical protein